MDTTIRVKHKHKPMSEMSFAKKGNIRQCSICGFYYPENGGKISKTNKGWVCVYDEDPDSR